MTTSEWFLFGLVVASNVVWYLLDRIISERMYRLGKAAGFQDAIETVNNSLEVEGKKITEAVNQKIREIEEKNIQLPMVPLRLWKCEGHYHVAMKFGGVYTEQVIPADWEKLDGDKRKDFFRFIRKEVTDEILRVGNLDNERGNNAKV